MELQLQINKLTISDPTSVLVEKGVLITPPIDSDFWLWRVSVSDSQAVVGFPKIGLIGIGFQHETDWNLNLPSSCKAENILRHILPNKGDASVSDELCLQAIRMIQKAAKRAQRSADFRESLSA